jgi:REP element-mobilizing transposase RayT
MANTYTQLYVHYVFTVLGRENLIKEEFRNEIEKVICGIITHNNCKTYAIYCNPDHTHIFVGLHPTISPSKLIEQIKSGSSKWLNDKNYIAGRFYWQDGFGAFSYSKSQIDKVVKYILNQPAHHMNQSFKDEYISLLDKFEVDYNPKYLFEWYDHK